jgi:hypothetical protein
MAGLGTPHPGTGYCRFHGGNLPTQRKNAIVQEAVKFMGAPKEINPLDAIIWCIQLTAGEVEWLGEQIALIDEEEWIEHTPLGKQMHVLQRTRADAQDRLVRYSRDAIQLGLAERAVRLAEPFGAAIGLLVEGVEPTSALTKAAEDLAEHRSQAPATLGSHVGVADDDRQAVLAIERNNNAPSLRGANNLPAGTANAALRYMFPQPDPYLTDPGGWRANRLGEQIWSKQEDICQSVVANRYTAVKACHGPGKSFIAARIGCWWLNIHKLGDAFLVTTSPSWPQVQAILWREIRRAWRIGRLPGRITLECQAQMGKAEATKN